MRPSKLWYGVIVSSLIQLSRSLEAFEAEVNIDYSDLRRVANPRLNPNLHNLMPPTGNTAKEAEELKVRYTVYWGQNSYGASHPAQRELWEKPIEEYCADDTVDIMIVSFLNIFNAGTSKPPELNLSYHCNTTFDKYPNLLHCPDIGKGMMECQQRGKKILLSLGGAAGAYGFQSAAEASNFAKTIWNMFLGGKSDVRPFGQQTVLDGVDLDIEGGSSVGYPEFIHTLRELYVTNMNRRFYIAGAPQCVYPDAFLGSSMDQSWFDYVFVQFYNNYCGVQAYENPNGFNFDRWDSWARNNSINPRVRIFLGVPGSPTAANNGYMDPKSLEPILKSLSYKFPSFGGVMAWDASQAGNNKVAGTIGDAPSTSPTDGDSGGELYFSNFISKTLREVVLSHQKPQSAAIASSSNGGQGGFESARAHSHIQRSTQKTKIIRFGRNRSLKTREVEGTSCSGRKMGCLGNNGYAMCVQGIWVRGECPTAHSCSEKGLSSGHLCQPNHPKKATGSDEPIPPPNTKLTDDYGLQIIPLTRLNSMDSLTLVKLWTRTNKPIRPNWKLEIVTSPGIVVLRTTQGVINQAGGGPGNKNLTFYLQPDPKLSLQASQQQSMAIRFTILVRALPPGPTHHQAASGSLPPISVGTGPSISSTMIGGGLHTNPHNISNSFRPPGNSSSGGIEPSHHHRPRPPRPPNSAHRYPSHRTTTLPRSHQLIPRLDQIIFHP